MRFGRMPSIPCVLLAWLCLPIASCVLRWWLQKSTTLSRTSAVMVSLFAGFAFLLATAGLYASVTYSFAQRRLELAIRAALGATPAKLLRLIFTEASSLIVPGVV